MLYRLVNVHDDILVEKNTTDADIPTHFNTLSFRQLALPREQQQSTLHSGVNVNVRFGLLTCTVYETDTILQRLDKHAHDTLSTSPTVCH